MKYLVVGLGNIGAEYAATRHNIGFRVLDALAEASNISFTTVRYGAMATLKHRGRTVLLLKPSTYMNLAHNCLLDLTVDVELNDVRVRGVDELTELLSVDSECDLLAATVDDARYLTLATRCLSELLTEIVTSSTVNLN